MNKISKADITGLIETEDLASVSMYFSTHKFPTSEHITEDKIRFKNLMKKAEEMLERKEIDGGVIRHIKTLLEETVLYDENFWQETTEGIALFCSPAGVRCFHIPDECDEYVYVGDQYDIAPLLAVVSWNVDYYVLALATKHPAIYSGDMYGIAKVDEQLPESIEKALNIDELYSNSQTSRNRGSQSGHPGAKAHGQGDSRQAGQEERLKYFRLIDETVLSSRKINSDHPILLAGTEDEISEFRDVSRNKRIMSGSLRGNYTNGDTNELHNRSWPLVEKEICQTQNSRLIEKIQNLLGTGLASTQEDEILIAAGEGKIDTLLVGLLHNTMDSIGDRQEEVRKLSISDEYEQAGVRESSRSTFKNGGEVIGAIRNDMPEGKIIAALFRY